MKFFKFIDENDSSISGRNRKIVYVKGERVIVENANPDTRVQCSTGIHCICMDSDKPIDTENIVYGPKIAILEATEEEIIYFSEDGKCRLKSCLVTDVIKTEDLDVKLLVGRGNGRFFYNVLRHLSNLQIDEDKYNNFQKVIKEYFPNENYERAILEKVCISTAVYEEWLEKALINAGFIQECISLAIRFGKYFEPNFFNKIFLKNANIYRKIEWCEKFGANSQIEKSLQHSSDIVVYAEKVRGTNALAKKILENKDTYRIEQFAKYYKTKEIEDYIIEHSDVGSLAEYGVAQKKYNSKITEAILNRLQEKKYVGYSDRMSLKDYILKYSKKPEIIDLVKFDITLCLAFYKETGILLDEVYDLLKVSQSYISEFYRIKPDIKFYNVLVEDCNTINNVLSFIAEFGIEPNLIKKIDFDEIKNGWIDNSLLFKIIVKNHKKHNVESFKKLFWNEKTYVDPDTIFEYCYYVGYDSFIKEYISSQSCHSLSTLLYYMKRKYGKMECFRELVQDMIDKETDESYKKHFADRFEEIPNYYFKVAQRKHGGRLVNAFAGLTEDEPITYYFRKVKPVVEGAVFDNYFAAEKFRCAYQSYFSCLGIYTCSGDNFKPLTQRLMRDFENDSKYEKVNGVHFELEGSGILYNIQINKNRVD